MAISLPSQPRFLISRLSAIGDCVHTLPLACALREAFPESYIGWVTQGGGAKILQGHRAINELITVDRRWYRSWTQLRGLRERLRSLAIDVSLDPQSLSKSSLLPWLSGARVRIGFARGQGREIAPLLNNWLVAPERIHVVDRYLELLRPLGISQPNVDFSLIPPRTAQHSIDRFLLTHQLERFSVINPGAGWESKLWHAERYAEVARYLRQVENIPSVVVWADDREKDWAESIVAQSRAAILAPATSLTELAAICRRACLFVGSDTGPLHIAAAVGTPCVGMYGPTRPETCGPYGSQHVAVQIVAHEGSSRERRSSSNWAMSAISVDHVTAACRQALSRDQRENRPLTYTG